MIALGLNDDRVMLVDEETGDVRCAVQAAVRTTRGANVTMSLSGRFVASVGLEEQPWKLWDAASGAVHRVAARQTELVRASAGRVSNPLRHCRHAP